MGHERRETEKATSPNCFSHGREGPTGGGTLDRRPCFFSLARSISSLGGTDTIQYNTGGRLSELFKLIASTQSSGGGVQSPCLLLINTTCQISSRMQAAGGMQSVGKGVALRQYRKSMLSMSMRKNCKQQLNQRVGRSLWRRHLEGLSEPS